MQFSADYQGPVLIINLWPTFCEDSNTMNPILISNSAATKPSTRRLALGVAVLATAAFAMASTSCATTKGFGRDVQKVGDKIETKAERTGGAN